MEGLTKMYLGARHAVDDAKKQRAQRVANSWQGKMMQKSWQYKHAVKKREKKLKEGADLRKLEEEDTTKGERVWFSRCLLSGRLQHWVIITHGTKYELRRADHVASTNGKKPDQNQREYVCNIKPYTIDQEKRDISLTELLTPEVDGYYVCLIGWTRMSAEQVGAIAQQVLSAFGRYDLLRNNCQDFLRQLAERILVPSPRAADFKWFMSNTKTQYQIDQWLEPPPAELMMRMMDGIAAQTNLHAQQHMQHMQHQQHMQNQMQNQMQIQMQTQLQTQLQMQLQTQMQMQMMSSMPMGGGS